MRFPRANGSAPFADPVMLSRAAFSSVVEALRRRIEERFKWNVRVPDDQELMTLTTAPVAKISVP